MDRKTGRKRVRGDIRRLLWPAVLAFLLGVAGMSSAAFAQSGTVVRELPASALPGVPFNLDVQVTPQVATTAYAVEETLPPGWTAASISHGGRYDAASKKIRWGPYFDDLSRRLACLVAAPADAGGTTGVFKGSASFDGAGITTTGPVEVPVQSRETASRVARTLPLSYSPSVKFTVAIAVNPAANVEAYAVEETVASGWTVTGANEGGAYDAAGQRIRWGPFFGSQSRTLTYEIIPAASAIGTATFEGSASFDGGMTRITGDSVVNPNASRVTRALPESYRPSVPLTLTLTVVPATNTGTYAVEERLPAGWTAGDVDNGGLFDTSAGMVRWGPFNDDAPRVLTASLTPPADVPAVMSFQGAGAFDGARVVTGGPAVLRGMSAFAVRELPTNYFPGIPFVVRLHVTPADSTEAWAVEETVPEGWAADSVSHGGVYGAGDRKLRWGPVFGGTPQVLTYRLVPPVPAVATVALAGTASFDGETAVIGGPSDIGPPPLTVTSTATRILPAVHRSGRPLSYTLEVRPAANVSAYAVEETLPPGYSPSSLADGGVFEAATRTIRWGPFFDATPRDFAVTLPVPPANASFGRLVGAISVDGARQSVAGQDTLALLPDSTPSAAPDSFVRNSGEGLTIPVSALLSNDTDPEGDVLALAGFDSSSSGGGTIILSGANLVFTPLPGSTSADSFSYTITDGYGLTATGVVSIAVNNAGASQNLLRITRRSDGLVDLVFAGLPRRTYLIQAATSPSGAPWETLGSRQTSPLGRLEFTDMAAAGLPGRFYRTATP